MVITRRQGRSNLGEAELADEVRNQGVATLAVFAAWLLYVGVGVIWSCLVLDWNVLDGFYFALSSLSAGGMFSIPDGTAEYVYGVAGIYTAVGIPLMVLAFGLAASFVLTPAAKDMKDV